MEANGDSTSMASPRQRAIREEKYLSLTDSTYADMSRQTPEPDMVETVPSFNRTPTVMTETEAMDDDDVSIAESAVPPPLIPGRKSRNRKSLPPVPSLVIHRPRATPWDVPLPPARAYGGSALKLQEQLGVEGLDMNHYYLDQDSVPQSRAPSRTLRSPSRTLRSSVKRFSLTPSDMPYPVGLLSSIEPDGHSKAERMLGLRSESIPPPVPPKTSTTSRSTISTLPLYQEHSSTETLEPQNARTAWLLASTAALIVFNCWGMANAFGLFQAYYERDYLLGTSPSAIAWIGSTQLALVFGLGVPVGRLVDKGYFRLMFHSGSVIMVLGIFCTAWCHDLWSLWLVQGLLTGVGMGMVFCSGIVALMTWFDERKIGIALGLGAAGSCVGGIVYVLLARHFLITNGFPTTMRILGAVTAATMIPPNIVFRIRGQKHIDVGFGRRGSKVISRSGLSWQTMKDDVSASYLLAAGGMFFAFLGLYFGFVYMISFASIVLKLSDTASTNLLIFMLAANLPGRFVPALISDRCIGPLNTIIPSIFLSAAVIGLWIASGDHNRGALTVIACFYGFVSAGIQVLYAPAVYTFCLEPVATTEMCPTKDATQLAMDRMGVKAGGIFTCVGLACLIGTPIGGALISYRTDRGMAQPYLGAQIFAACSLLLGGCLLLASRVARVGWQAKRA
ncbi:hypothetical protein LTR65_009530 [Meristemomyces frigidus]